MWLFARLMHLIVEFFSKAPAIFIASLSPASETNCHKAQNGCKRKRRTAETYAGERQVEILRVEVSSDGIHKI